MEIKILFSRDDEHYVCNVEINDVPQFRVKCRMDLCSQTKARIGMMREVHRKLEEIIPEVI